mmetsp:Transcript_56102/g.110693  ORF Transcript_56102/g.110693 Transcript_56102/m.110693 type:complete len:184 (+) Transcript_56102:18-569(+)
MISQLDSNKHTSEAKEFPSRMNLCKTVSNFSFACEDVDVDDAQDISQPTPSDKLEYICTRIHPAMEKPMFVSNLVVKIDPRRFSGLSCDSDREKMLLLRAAFSNAFSLSNRPRLSGLTGLSFFGYSERSLSPTHSDNKEWGCMATFWKLAFSVRVASRVLSSLWQSGGGHKKSSVLPYTTATQ